MKKFFIITLLLSTFTTFAQSQKELTDPTNPIWGNYKDGMPVEATAYAETTCYIEDQLVFTDEHDNIVSRPYIFQNPLVTVVYATNTGLIVEKTLPIKEGPRDDYGWLKYTKKVNSGIVVRTINRNGEVSFYVKM